MALNILIVDDSLLTRKKIRRIIEMTDLEVGEFFDAENGAEALKTLTDTEINLVLADLNMPEMGGAEMVHHMKSSTATCSIPVVVISTESKTTRIKELLAEGVKDYLHKPFTPEEFKEVIHTLWKPTETNTENMQIEAITEALETMAFMTVMPIEEEMIIPHNTILAEISFSGTKNGTMQIIGGVDFCKVLAENIGALDEADEKAAFDAVRELSNVTCGLFLPMVVSSTADMFDITVPKVHDCSDDSEWNNFVKEENSCILNIEGYATAIKVHMED